MDWTAGAAGKARQRRVGVLGSDINQWKRFSIGNTSSGKDVAQFALCTANLLDLLVSYHLGIGYTSISCNLRGSRSYAHRA